jgi:hypothetical protein
MTGTAIAENATAIFFCHTTTIVHNKGAQEQASNKQPYNQ